MPLFVADRWSARAEGVMAAQGSGLLLSDLAGAEFTSAIALSVRTRQLSPSAARAAFSAFDAWAVNATVPVGVTTEDFARAADWLRGLSINLRAPDATHLALAARLGAVLITFDEAMATAARALGIPMAEA